MTEETPITLELLLNDRRQYAYSCKTNTDTRTNGTIWLQASTGEYIGNKNGYSFKDDLFTNSAIDLTETPLKAGKYAIWVNVIYNENV